MFEPGIRDANYQGLKPGGTASLSIKIHNILDWIESKIAVKFWLLVPTARSNSCWSMAASIHVLK